MNIYLQLFIAYFKVGLFTIGGGYAMIPLVQQAVVVDHPWLTMGELTDFIGVAESTPGPFAINTATFVGLKVAGIPGALCTTFGVILPSIIIILFIAKCFGHFSDNRWVKAALYGMSAVVVGLVAAAVYLLFMEIFIQSGSGLNLDLRAIAIMLVCVAMYFKVKVGPIPLILIAAGSGILAYGLLPMVI